MAPSVHQILSRAASFSYNPFVSTDDEGSQNCAAMPLSRTASERIQYTNRNVKRPTPGRGNSDRDLLLDNGDCSGSATQARNRDFNENGSYENQTMEELEQYAVYKSKDTTATFTNSIKVAEEIREGAAKTLTDLHRQGEQIRQTHNVALNIDHDLSIGEKLLGSLGGIFSKPWRPVRTRPMKGPATIQGNSIQRVRNDQEQRQDLGLVKSSQRKEHTQIHPSGAGNTKACVEIEKVKQDDCLSDLSNILDQLKDMAIDMGQEMGRQNKAVDHLSEDVSELGFRIKEANARSRRLLGK